MNCQCLLSSGPNRGKQCSASAKDGTPFCRRHKLCRDQVSVPASGVATPVVTPVVTPEATQAAAPYPKPRLRSIPRTIARVWETTGTCSHLIVIDPSKPTYAYDFDDTLVLLRTSDFLPGRLDRIREQAKTHNIVVMSNQGGISKGKTSHSIVRGLMEHFLSKVGVAVSFLYSSDEDIYRKPATGMADIIREKGAGTIEWYCGDAAGRKGDFSISDLYLANNIGVRFVTPEQIFNGLPYVPPLVQKAYPEDVWKDGYQVNDHPLLEVMYPEDVDIGPHHIKGKLVLMVGPQACGKSTLSAYLSRLYGAVVINSDSGLKTKAQMERAFRKARVSDAGIIIDNTNTKAETRDYWCSLASGMEVTTISFELTKLQVFHLVKYREAHGGPHIPAVAVHTTFKYYDRPEATLVISGAVSSHPFMHRDRYVT